MAPRLLLLFFAVTLLTARGIAAYSFLGKATGWEYEESRAIIHCADNVSLKIEFLAPEIFRVVLIRPNDTEALLDYPLVKSDSSAIKLDFAESDSAFTIRSTALDIGIKKSPCRLVVKDKAGNVVNEDDPGMGMGWDGQEIRCWKTITPDEKFFGLGMKSGNVNRRGREWTMWNSDVPAYTDNTDPLYQSIPFFTGIRSGSAYGIYLNNSYRSHFNLGAGNLRYYSFSAEQGNLDYFFIYGPKIADVVSRYSEITGRMPLPPLWALGYQQCRWSYYPQSRVMELARTFREKNIPADVIYLDIHHMDGYRVFTWDKERFPDPMGMLNNLAEMGFKVVTIVDPGVKADSNYRMAHEGLATDMFVHYPDGQIYTGEVWPGKSYFPDFSAAKTRLWWGDHAGSWLKSGIAGCWNDMNEPAVWGQAFPPETLFDDEGRHASHKKIHNLYGLLMARATYEGALRAQPAKRPFILTRAGFAGVQKYAAAWTGDNVASWEHLAMGIRMMQSYGVSGGPLVGTDIGGFMDTPTSELYARWIEVGALSPLSRTHTAYNTSDQEPWSFGDDVEAISRKYISLRYRLLPYLYSLFHEASQTGAPLMRPLFWSDQNDERTFYWDNQHEYFIGDKLLAAPVIRMGQTLQKVYLPEGRWLDWNTDSVYIGGKTIVVDAPLDRMPLFLREGAIIPLRGVEQFTSEKPLTQLFVDFFPSEKESRFELYEDAGEGFGYAKGEYRSTEWTCQQSKSEIRFSQKRTHDGYDAGKRGFELRVHATVKPESVTIDGKAYHESAQGDGYSYDPAFHLLSVRVADDSRMGNIIIH